MTGVCHIIIIIIIIYLFIYLFIIYLFFGDNIVVFSGVRSSLTLSVTLSIVTTLY